VELNAHLPPQFAVPAGEFDEALFEARVRAAVPAVEVTCNDPEEGIMLLSLPAAAANAAAASAAAAAAAAVLRSSGASASATMAGGGGGYARSGGGGMTVASTVGASKAHTLLNARSAGVNKDWECGHCSHFNFAGRTNCQKCSSPSSMGREPAPCADVVVNHHGGASPEELRARFSVHGKITAFHALATNCFLSYASSEQAAAAIKAETGVRLPSGRYLLVMPAREPFRARHPPM
jgi:hypothetical protein